MIDVGANVGDTAAIVRSVVEIPILCIDGDDRYFSLLELNFRQWPGVELERAFVAAQSGVIQGRLASDYGSGHIVRDVGSVTTVRTLQNIISKHPKFSSAKLLKIDTDGFDTLIIRGAMDFLSTEKPAIFFEYDPHYFKQHDPLGFSIFEDLRGIGYQSALFFENTGELLARVSLGDVELLSDLNRFCSNRFGKRYFDVFVAHSVDADILDGVREASTGLTASCDR
jgi:FkbM family methyltransferase